MAPGLRTLLVVLCFGQALALWWMSGQQGPVPLPAGEKKQPPKADAPKTVQKFPPGRGYAATATVDVASPGHSIPDAIYGACDLPPEKVAAYRIPLVRWGGNRSSRFNWKRNADAAGKDWFFKNGGREVADLADGGWPRFLRTFRSAGAGGYVTVPMLGYVAKDNHSYAFSVKKYGPQQAAEMGHPDVGNGVRPDGTPVTGNDWRDTSVEVGPEFMAEGVRLAAKHAGPGPRYWALDNEPMLWHETHRDVRPRPLGYDELWDRTVAYAEAIRKADPAAKIAGFCSWGWTDLFYSAADEGGDRYRTRPDNRAHGRVPLAEWFIRKCGEYRRRHGKPLVDVFDFHWYPQAERDGRTPHLGTGMDPAFNQLRLRTTRDLWDPEYEQESWVRNASDGKATMVVRRVREWIEKHNPGMEVCLGEYNFGGADNITGALAQADVFGILGRERADLAFIWTRPEGTQELAWQLFRNHDGAGGRFGDRHLPARSDQPSLSAFAAQRSKDGATTVVLVNKDLGGSCEVTLNLAGLTGQARVWRFDQESGGKVVEAAGDAGPVDGKVALTLPAASGTILVLSADDPFIVPRGQLTFDAEGNEGGRWHSRTPHVPSESSGLTIGRGYDMKHRSREQVVRQLTAAGLAKEAAGAYAGGARLSGEAAREYMRRAGLPEITAAQQRALFLITYAEIEDLTRKLCTSPAVVKEYGPVHWDRLHPAIRDLVIDLRYRGDYTDRTRKLVQPHVVKNDLSGLAAVLGDREKWTRVPPDRFRRRAEYARKAAE